MLNCDILLLSEIRGNAEKSSVVTFMQIWRFTGVFKKYIGHTPAAGQPPHTLFNTGTNADAMAGATMTALCS